MPEVRGFCGWRYAPEVAGHPNTCITPPYDVISAEERASLAASNPNNFVHVLLPEPDGDRNRYTVAGETLAQWIAAGVLRQDEAPSYYLLRQRFTDLDGNPQERRGFFGVVRLPEEGERTILGHERTFDNPVEDRLRLTEAVHGNLGAVFVLHNDAQKRLTAFLGQMDTRAPDLEAHTFDGVAQAFWRVSEDPAVNACLKDEVFYIADGHHRFRTACAYRDAQRAAHNAPAEPQPYDYALMGFVAFDDPGLKIYPPHRLVATPEGFDAATFLRDLETWFEVSPVDSDLPTRVERGQGATVMGVRIHGAGEFLLTLKEDRRVDLLGNDRDPAWRDLDVAVLHRGILERVLGFPEGSKFGYEKNLDAALEAVDTGSCGLAFILRATRADQIRACAEAGEPMPQKSTYFFPKLPSGGVIYRHK